MKKILVVISLIICILCYFKKDELYVIPNNSIRYRIIANSNTIKDQEIKSKLSINLEKYLTNLLKNTKSDKEAFNTLLENKSNIESYINNYLNTNNIKTNYNLSIGNNYFPNKEYKGVKYEAGYYNSIVVNLGVSKGLNWWCVIYPPLCLVDNDNEVKYTSLVKEIIEKYNI